MRGGGVFTWNAFSYFAKSSFCHSPAGVRADIRTVQELLGYASVETTMIYPHVETRPGSGVRSPLDSGTE